MKRCTKPNKFRMETRQVTTSVWVLLQFEVVCRHAKFPGLNQFSSVVEPHHCTGWLIAANNPYLQYTDAL